MKPWSLSFRYLAGTILFLIVVAFIYYARDTLEPLIVAAFIAYLINPVVMLLNRYTQLSRKAAVNVVYFSALALLIITPASLTPIFFEELKEVARDLLSGTEKMQALLATPLEIGGLSLDLGQIANSLTHFKSNFSSPVPADAFLLLESTSRGAIWFLVILVCVYLFLSGWPTMREWLFSLAPPMHRPEVEVLYQRVRAIWLAYLRGQLLLMLIVGVVFTIAWTILGIPGALVLGAVAGLFTLVPDIGPLAAALMAMAVALLQGSKWIALPNFGVMLIVLAVYLVLINIKNLWLRPIIMGRSVNMNEGLVLVAILVATILNGILGALLVVPVLASAVIVLDFLIKSILGNTHAQAEKTYFLNPEIDTPHKLARHLRPRPKKFNRN